MLCACVLISAPFSTLRFQICFVFTNENEMLFNLKLFSVSPIFNFNEILCSENFCSVIQFLHGRCDTRDTVSGFVCMSVTYFVHIECILSRWITNIRANTPVSLKLGIDYLYQFSHFLRANETFFTQTFKST